MDNTAGGWLALGALIALAGTWVSGRSRYLASRRSQRRFGFTLIVLGVLVAAGGIGYTLLPDVPVSRTVTVPPETIPPVAAPGPGFWASMSDSEQFIMIFFGIALLGLFIGRVSDRGDLVSGIFGSILGIGLLVVGIAGMVVAGIIWLIR